MRFILKSVYFCFLVSYFGILSPYSYADQIKPPTQETDPVQEVLQDRAKANSVYSGFNQNNPLSASYGTGPSGQISDSSPLQIDPKLASLQKMSQFMSNPYFQKLMKLVSDPQFLKTLTDLATHPERKTLAIAEAVFFLFFIFLKSWMSYKVESRRWFILVFARISLWIFYLAVSTCGIPFFVFGDTYINIIKSLCGMM